jgi:hypothetical protein
MRMRTERRGLLAHQKGVDGGGATLARWRSSEGGVASVSRLATLRGRDPPRPAHMERQLAVRASDDEATANRGKRVARLTGIQMVNGRGQMVRRGALKWRAHPEAVERPWSVRSGGAGARLGTGAARLVMHERAW